MPDPFFNTLLSGSWVVSGGKLTASASGVLLANPVSKRHLFPIDANKPGSVDDLVEWKKRFGTDGMDIVTGHGLDGLEDHHLLPKAKEFKKHWERLGIDIDEFMVGVDEFIHRRGSNHLHGKDFAEWQGHWNQRWLNELFKEYPKADRKQVFDFAKKMIDENGLD